MDVLFIQKLWAKNTETGEQDWKPVTRIFVEPDRGIYEINLLGQDGFKQKIEATDDHPFFVVGKAWKTTIELEVCDYLETDGDGAMLITSVIDEKRQDLTYNFTVDDFHTYYVTEQKVLVHNCSLNTKSSPHGDKVAGSETEVKNAVSEAKVHKILGDSSKADCAKCKLNTSIESRTKEQSSFEAQGQSKSSDEYKNRQRRIEFEKSQLEELE